MDTLFPRTFLLVFAQLSVGGLFCVSIPPFHDMDRGYYKSSAFVFWGIGALATLGHFALWLRPDSTVGGFELLLWGLYCLAAGGYLASLWYEYFIIRARCFTAAWMLGAVALLVGGFSFAGASPLLAASLVYPLSFLTGAMVLGTAASGMLLGHWYLIDRDLSLTPLWNILGLYLGCLAVEIAVLFLASLLAVASDSAALWREWSTVFLGRALISPLGTGVLGLMIWRTLQIPQTMAATGLFYIAVLGAIVGEVLGRYLLFRTGLPL